MKCQTCGHEIPETAKFCAECGMSLQGSGKALSEQTKTDYPPAPERKQVTVLFSDLTGYTAITEKVDPELLKELTGSIFAGVKEIVARYDGFIERVMGDGVVVFFGVPQSHEDDAIRAVHTALEIHDLVKALSPHYEALVGSPISMHSGINTGLVVTADVDTERGTHGMVGDAVNVAARLSGLAGPGEILLGEEIFRRTRERFTFHDLGLKKVKGKADPVSVFKLIAAKAPTTAIRADRQIFSEMVGRDTELDRLELQVMKVINGEGSVVNVVGEAGIGKSRLIAELRRREVMKKVMFLEGRAISIGRQLSFHPIINLLRQWAGIAEGDPESTGFDKLERAIRVIHPDQAHEILPFLATLMGMKLKRRYAERIKGIEGEALEKLIFKNLRDLLVKGSELRPTVIVMEDMHWADDSSLGLLESLYRLAEKNRLIFINVFRPGFWQGENRALERISELLPGRYVEIVLQPLDKQVSEALIGNILDIKGLPHSLCVQIVERAGGNPFFIEEVARSLIDQGAIVRRNGSFEITEKINSVIVPHTINDVLMARIDRLEERTRELLKCASVIGRSFFDRILKDVATSVEDIDSKLTYLKEIQLVRDRIRMQELEYLFKHALTQEVAYESTLLQQRKETHRKVAQSIEKLFQERLHEFYGMLAYHYSKAEDPEKAEYWMVKAGEEALRSSASSEALYYYTEALNLYLDKYGDAADPAKLSMFEKNIALAYFNKGQFENALRFFDKIFRRWGRRPDTNRLIIFSKVILNISFLFIRPYLPSLRRKKIPDEHVNEFFDLASKKDMALLHVNPARSFVEQIRETRESCKYDLSKLDSSVVFHVGISGLFAFSGFLRMADWYLNHAKKLVRHDKTLEQIYLLFSVNFNNLVAGRWNEIRQIDKGLVETSLSSGFLWHVQVYLYFFCSIKIAQGQFSDAEELIQKQLLISDQYGYELSLDGYYLSTIEYIIVCKKYYEAQLAANEYIKFCNERGLEHELHGYGLRAIAEVMVKDIEAARVSLEHFNAMLAKRGLCPPYYIAAGFLAQFMLDLVLLEDSIGSENTISISKHRRNAFKNGKRSLRLSKKFPLHRTETYRLIGRYYWLIGKQKKSLRWYSKSSEEGQRLDARPELARTYFELGKRLQDPGSKYRHFNGLDAGGYLEKARSMFEQMGLEKDLEEMDKL
jgi:class 3 adenylate cyclase